jgi:hypothetical protein
MNVIACHASESKQRKRTKHETPGVQAMSKLIKIIVIDSGGDEHLFHEEAGEEEHYIDIAKDSNPATVKITCRIFEDGSKTYTSEIETTFLNPRRIDVIYGEF